MREHADNRSTTLWPLYLGVLVFVGVFSFLAWVKYVSGRFSINDLGTFEQAIWTFYEYGVSQHTIYSSGEPTSWLGFHFSPFILILSPFYAFGVSAFFLCIVQVLLVASATVPIYRSLQTLSLTRQISQLLTLLFLLHPFTVNGVLWDFHEVAFAVPLLAWANYGVLSRRFSLVCVMSALLVLVREHYGVAVFGLGILWGIYHQDWRRGIGLASSGLLVLAMVLLVIIPALNPDNVHTMLNANSIYDRYSWLLTSPQHYIKVLAYIFLDLNTVIFLCLVFFSFGPSTLLGIIFLLPALADVSAALLSALPLPRFLFAYHSLPLAPLIVIASGYGISTLRQAEQRKRRAFRTIVVGTMITLFSIWLTGSIDVWRIRDALMGNLTIPRQVSEIHEILSKAASEKATVSVQKNIGYFFSQRQLIYPFLENSDKDYIILHFDYPYENFSWAPFGQPFDGTKYIHTVRNLLEQKNIQILYYDSGWTLLKMTTPGNGENETEHLKNMIKARVEWMASTYGPME